jgi:hypothetical protein
VLIETFLNSSHASLASNHLDGADLSFPPDITESTTSYHFDSAALDTGCRPIKTPDYLEGCDDRVFKSPQDQRGGGNTLLPPNKKKRIFNFLQVTLSNKSQSQEEHKSPATQVMFVAANASIQQPPTVAAVEGPKKGRKFDFKIIAPEAIISLKPEEINHESYTQESEQ